MTTRLRGEDAVKLAKDARDKGDSVRGAILFAQKKFNCVACHSQGAADLLGPDLTRDRAEDRAEDRDREATQDVHFVESILLPSKEIRPEFATKTFLLADGRLIRGRVLTADDQRIVIRDASEPSRSMTIARADVDQEKADTKSVMPEGLADQLPNRQAFLDLVKYVMELSATETQPVPITHTASGVIKQPDDVVRGRVLLNRLGCLQCHERSDASDQEAFTSQSTTDSGLSPFEAPVLTLAATRIDPDYLRRFLADPQQLKPGTSMPNLMGHLEPGVRDSVAASVTLYLQSLTKEPFQCDPIDAEAATRGERLFHTVGCVACHDPRDARANELGLADSVPLGNLASKYSVASLSTFLENPHAVRPSGQMPNLQLTHWEAIEIASFLVQQNVQQGTDDNTAPAGAHEASELTSEDGDAVELGEIYFRQLGCVRCHQQGATKVKAAASAEQFSMSPPKIEQLDLERGCLSSESGVWPSYSFSEAEIALLRSAIESLSQPLSQSEHVSYTMASLRCYACHQRDGIGGVSEDRDPYFATANENLGPQGRMPPTLSGVGAKLHAKWMRQVMVSGRNIRPYLLTRMPKYDPEHVTQLMDEFQQMDELPSVEFDVPKDIKEFKKTGTELVGKDGLNCIACHTFQQKPAQTMPAVDLTEMAERLKPAWFDRYMRAPQRLSPNTVMPSFWPGGKAIRKEILDGDTDQQIAAVWEYLKDGRQARVPRGLRSEPIELLARPEHAVMLRRNYRGIGKRGIGVGYPCEVNLAFDAEQMRVASIWKGKFADPGGVWRGQGNGAVRPLGTDLIQFAPGPELDDARSPWVVSEGRPPNHRFTGYFLDEQSRPTFTYRWKEIDVEDSIVDRSAEPSDETRLVRTLTFDTSRWVAQNGPQSTPYPSLAFRLRSVDPMKSDAGGGVRLGQSLRVWTDADHPGEIVRNDAGYEYVIPLELGSKESTLTLHYAW
ncbi:MAG: hypothetical protein ACR2NZ_23880 [Rubripirellula sp.]